MKMKSLFAELYVHRNDPPEEFIKLPAFQELSAHPDIVEQIDPFELPEVIKLICYSPKLMTKSFAEKYRSIQPLYCKDQFEPLSVLQQFKTSELLELEILKYADFNILRIMDGFFVSMENEQKKLELRLKEQKAAIQSEKNGKNIDDGVLKSIQEQQEKDKKELAGIKRFLSKQKDAIEKIRFYKARFEKGSVEQRRIEAYQQLMLFDTEIEVKDILDQIFETGEVTRPQAVRFKDPVFLDSLLFYLSKAENRQIVMDVVLKLYDSGVIDINEPPVIDFIKRNTDLLLDYLLGMPLDHVSDTESENINVLVDLALEIEREYDSNGSCAKFCAFWNTLRYEFEWMWIFEKIATIYPNNFTEMAGCLMRGLVGKASKAYMNALTSSDKSDQKIEVFSCALSRSDCYEKDSIMNALRQFEKNEHSMRVKLNTSERSRNRQSQDLFSSLYLPLEHLEELAINLSITTDQVDSHLTGKQLRDQIAELRGALETFGLKPVADIDDWKNLKDVPFDPERHRFNVESTNQNHRVMYKSMGFSYKDDEGVQKERSALVFKKIARKGIISAKLSSEKSSFPLKRDGRTILAKSKELKSTEEKDTTKEKR